MAMRRAPASKPPGLKVTARFRKLLAGFPSRSVPTPGLFDLRLASPMMTRPSSLSARSEEHTSELQSHLNLVCRLLLEKKKKKREPVMEQLDETDMCYCVAV